MQPRVHLAVDNCFASKRWTSPAAWAGLVRDLGLKCVEASADNECDPLYMGPEYLRDWIGEVKEAEAATGVKVVNLYSGHGSYATLGLSHPDPRVRERMHRGWLEAMVDMAAELGAGLGFFCHAFSQEQLSSPERYAAARDELCGRLASLASRAEAKGVPRVGVEQMYSPQQIPWTIAGAEELLREVKARAGADFHLTIDTGHQCGQRKFLRPGYGQLKAARRELDRGGHLEGFWLGAESTAALFKAGALEDALADMERFPHLFAAHEDGDTYEWLERLGRFSPIVHLQQTDGKASAHLPFDARHNATGVIEGGELLRALAKSYRQEAAGMPKPCADIYLTLEIFAGTAELPSDIIDKLAASVAYWRRFVPEDGLTLDKLL